MLIAIVCLLALILSCLILISVGVLCILKTVQAITCANPYHDLEDLDDLENYVDGIEMPDQPASIDDHK